ncbi:hypothetical protein CDCA_CDCA12G3382 [Cyanidium caldarium]|uniref:Glycosyl hydrolase family 13 catalytic domain-containing protein n=1 Tax=Cyanidium caldarium TaxID=2771 RepID=A0AAV9IYK9_CYACA|nr:hypothetical protein CDCA_CDCA12G3382 [Cyanidium caldarium]
MLSKYYTRLLIWSLARSILAFALLIGWYVPDDMAASGEGDRGAAGACPMGGRQLVGGRTLLEVPARPLLYSLNVSQTLDAIPDFLVAQYRQFDFLWLQGVWKLGTYGLSLDRTDPKRVASYNDALPGWTKDDVIGSPYAIYDYVVSEAIGGESALRRFRQRIRPARLLLDFVPNHMARDCPWPETYFVHTSGPQPPAVNATTTFPIRAYGRDPYTGAWDDTAQLNYFNLATRRHQTRTLLHIASMCDGVRADMAMLALNEVFQRVWGDNAEVGAFPRPHTEFWSEAVHALRQQHPQFFLLAEVYWGLDGRLQELGFDCTYDKQLYDLLHARHLDNLRAYIASRSQEQHAHGAHFVENHDEPRAIAYFGGVPVANAAAAFSYLLPGLRFQFDGQEQGRAARLEVHLRRAADDDRPPDPQVQSFYRRLNRILALDIVRNGIWAYDDSGARQHWRLITWTWRARNCSAEPNGSGDFRRLQVVINYSDEPVQYVHAYTEELLSSNSSSNNNASQIIEAWGVRVFRAA